MFKKLKEKWGVGALQLFLVLCTFAIGGSLSGYVGKRLMLLLNIENKFLYIIIYIAIVTIIWPVIVLLVSIFFGQFVFFKQYLKKLFNKIIGRGR